MPWNSFTSSRCISCHRPSYASVTTVCFHHPTERSCVRCRSNWVGFLCQRCAGRSPISRYARRRAGRLASVRIVSVECKWLRFLSRPVLHLLRLSPHRLPTSNTPHHSPSKLFSWRTALIVPIRDSFSVSKIAFGWFPNRFFHERKAYRHLSCFISLLPDDVMSWSKPWLIPIEIYRPFRTTRSSNDLRSHEDLFSFMGGFPYFPHVFVLQN